MEKLKRFMVLVLVAFLGGLLSVGTYKLVEGNGVSSYDNLTQARKANYEFKSVTVPTFDFAEVSQVATPTVVHIKTKMGTKEVDESAGNNQRRQANPFDLFGDGFNFQMPRGPQEASGSGVIISEKGYIVTNNHVVADADEIEVILNDKRAYKADVLGRDPNTDLALIKINADGLTPIKLGNSDNVRVGEWVLAVGNPFNLTSTVTAGIVSAKGRSLHLIDAPTSVESFIQTDAAVNPGNSGGALINAKGELVGINTAIASSTGMYAGYSFAIPTSLMKKVIDDIMEFGEVQRGFLGVNIRDVDNKLAAEKELKSGVKGVYVEGMMDNGAADAAGVKKGDVIIKVDGQEVNSVPALQENISRHRPGDEVKIIIDREGKEKELSVILRNKDGKVGKVTSASSELRKSLGADFESVAEADMKKLKIGNGIKIKSLDKGKLKDAGVPNGFIITSVDKNGVYSSNDVYRLLTNKKGGVMMEGYLPNGEHKYYVLEMD